MPRIGILSSGDGWHLRALAAAFASLDCETIRLDVARLIGTVDARPTVGAIEGRVTGRPREETGGVIDAAGLDALVVRVLPPGSLDQIVFRMDCLHIVADAGTPVINAPRAIERTVDKHWCSRILHDAGIPTPRTVAVECFDDAMETFRQMRDVVVKPLFGAGGKGIFRVTDEDLAYRSFRALQLSRSVFYLQEFVPHGNTDLRLFVVGEEVVASSRRIGNGWKTNIAAGAGAVSHTCSADEREMAIRACHAVGADYSGVDIVETADGRRLVLEVNGIPGWSALQRTTPVDLALAIARLVQTRLLVRHGSAREA